MALLHSQLEADSKRIGYPSFREDSASVPTRIGNGLVLATCQRQVPFDPPISRVVFVIPSILRFPPFATVRELNRAKAEE